MGGGIFRMPLDMETKLLGILSVSGGMLISSHAFGENIMGYSEADLQKSVQETAYKFWEHCHEGDHDKGKIGGLEFVKPEKVAPGVKPKPKKKPEIGTASKWKGVSWEDVKAMGDDEKKKEYGQYVVANKLPLPEGLNPFEEQKYFKLKKVDKDKNPPPKPKPKKNVNNMSAAEILLEMGEVKVDSSEESSSEESTSSW